MPHRRRGILSKLDLLVVELSKAKLSSIYLAQIFFGCPRCRFYTWVLSQRTSAYSAPLRYLFFFLFSDFPLFPSCPLRRITSAHPSTPSQTAATPAALSLSPLHRSCALGRTRSSPAPPFPSRPIAGTPNLNCSVPFPASAAPPLPSETLPAPPASFPARYTKFPAAHTLRPAPHRTQSPSSNALPPSASPPHSALAAPSSTASRHNNNSPSR